jgi:PilZ domain
MSVTLQTERRARRLTLALPVRVEAQEEKDVYWREITHLINVSSLGAGFYANHKFAVGQLLRLTMPLPRGLRSYDHSDERYCVWGIVRHCNPPKEGSSNGYHVGVAFIGKHPPNSYKENPMRLYKLTGVSGDGLWQLGGGDEEERRQIIERRHERYHIPINVYLAVFDKQDNVVAQEYTVTENISVGGASVFSALSVKVGDFVKVGCDQYNVFLSAVVRHLRTGEDGLPRLHLEFVGDQFPLQGIEQI